MDGEEEMFKRMLEAVGFFNVKLEKTIPPEQFIEMSGEEGEEDDLLSAYLAGEVSYFRVRTHQGSFGILTGSYPLLDLEGTGLDFIDLGSLEAPDGFSLCPFSRETALRLRELLEARPN